MVHAGLDGVEFIVANTDLQALQLNARAAQAADRREADQGARRRRRSERRPAGGARRHREADRSARRRRHGVRDDRPRRRHRHRRRAGHRQPGQRARRADHRGRDQAVQVRRAGSGSSQAERGLDELRDCVDTVITIPNERLLATIAPHDLARRRVHHRGRCAAAGDPGHLGPDPGAGADQPRLRRREDDHVRHGPRDHGHRPGRRREPGDGRRQRRRSRARCSRTRRSRAPAA